MQGIRPNYHRGGYFRGNRGNNQFRNSYEPRAERNENNIKQFWCETCDRDFNSSYLLEQHKRQHETCKIDGCTFVAHPKVITKHIQMQHSSGLFNKISKLNNPDEIQKWREERKKRYPTKQNIELKIAQAKEKFNRGEKLDQQSRNNKPQQKDLKRNNRRRTRPQKTPKLQNDDNRNVTPKMNEKKPPALPKAIPELEVRTKLKPFAGIQELNIESDEEEVVGNNLLIEDDEFVADTVIEPESENKAVVCGALSNLIMDYGSSDEEPEAVVATTLKEPAPNDITIPKPTMEVTVIKHDKSDSDSGPDEVTITKKADLNDSKETDLNNTPAPEKPKLKRPHNFKNDRKQPPKRYKPKPQSTLLTKLLAKEIRQERNMVLQCVRHIVKNNYFSKK